MRASASHAETSRMRATPFAEWGTGVSRLVRRVTLGVNSAEIARANELGWQGYLNYQLNHTRIDDRSCESIVTGRWPISIISPDFLLNVNAAQAQTQLREATMYRAAFSKRQLFERMVEFWTDHFSQDIYKVQQLLVTDQRDVIRKHALGKFPDMVRASAKSAAMLAYLDQIVSKNTSPNENYAREIMELHTLGVDGGYTQTDVAELARVFTGWTISGASFSFNPSIHDWGAKTVMGVHIPAGSPSMGQEGMREGERIIDMLVQHPNTARFIATKMLKWLLDPAPSESQISTVAAVYRATGGDIKSMIRVILNETWMSSAPMKLKRPYHFVVSALRGANPVDATIGLFTAQVAALGQQLFAWETPDGYPDAAEYWAGNIMPKWNFASSLTTVITINTNAYLAGSTAAAIDLLDQNFFGGEMPLRTRNGLLAYAGTGPLTDVRVRELMTLVVCSNAFQWY